MSSTFGAKLTIDEGGMKTGTTKLSLETVSGHAITYAKVENIEADCAERLPTKFRVIIDAVLLPVERDKETPDAEPQ